MPHQTKKHISFFGNTYTDNGIIDKVRDIQDMPTPENREDLHRFIGMMTYLSQFIPHFAEKAHTLRGLLKKDVPWMWDVDHQKSFDELKHAVSTSACLQYYDPRAPVQLEVDATSSAYATEDTRIQLRDRVSTRRQDDSRRRAQSSA